MPRKKAVPAYCLHKPSGLAYLKVNRKPEYLGPHNSPESLERYARRIAELAILPTGRPDPTPAAMSDMRVVELLAMYREFASSYYVKNGQPTSQMTIIRLAENILTELYGRTEARAFGPLALKAIQQKLIERDFTRASIAHVVGTIRRIFKWAVSQELLPASVQVALSTVAGLRAGRSKARETAPVPPVPDDVVNKTLPHLTPVLAAMVRVQRLAGMRPTEVCRLRPMDLDRSGDVWQYRVDGHKTEHHGRDRVVYIGPQAQQVLLPYLLRPADAFCFSPAESVGQHRATRHEARKIKPRCGNRPGTNRKARPKRAPKDRYTKDSYNRAVCRACEIAFGMPSEWRKLYGKGIAPEERSRRRKLASEWREKHCWSPNQLRHAAATQIRKTFNLEASRVALGHSTITPTQLYAEQDSALGVEIARKLG